MTRPTNHYSAIIATIFAKYHQPGLTTFNFRREDIVTAANELGISLPKNIGDVLYSFRYRADLPTSVTEQAPEGYEWVYVFPVQAKGGSDKLGIVQIEQDFAMCAQKFPGLICKPIAAQFADPSLSVLFAFEQTPDGLRIVAERHYRLVDAEALTNEEIAGYQMRPE